MTSSLIIDRSVVPEQFSPVAAALDATAGEEGEHDDAEQDRSGPDPDLVEKFLDSALSSWC